MIKFNLYNGTIKFVKHSVEFTADETHQRMTFYNTADKDAFIQRLEGDYTVTDYDEPSAELLARVEGKKFNTIAAAKVFIDGEKTDKDRIDDLELLILELGGII